MHREVRANESADAGGGVEVEQVALPGVGLRHTFLTRQGRRVGVLSHRAGQRDLLIYSTRDPDACSEVIGLGTEESDTLAELLGAPRIVEKLAAIRDQVAGLVIEQLPIEAGSSYAGRTLADTQARSRTGASIVAVLREGDVIPSPTPDFRFEAGDLLVAVGTPDGLEGIARILAS
jgi:TrkA domain protein